MQGPHNGEPILERRDRHRRLLCIILRSRRHVRAVLDQPVDNLPIALPYGLDQRNPTVLLRMHVHQPLCLQMV